MTPVQCPKCRCYWWKMGSVDEEGPDPVFNVDQFGEIINYFGRLLCAQCEEPWLPMPDRPLLKTVS